MGIFLLIWLVNEMVRKIVSLDYICIIFKCMIYVVCMYLVGV